MFVLFALDCLLLSGTLVPKKQVAASDNNFDNLIPAVPLVDSPHSSVPHCSCYCRGDPLPLLERLAFL